jgi:hypothetical protein
MTAGILAIMYPDTDAVLDIDPLAFITTAQVSTFLNVADPDFQPYIAQAWASFQAERDLKDSHSTKRVRFDGIAVASRKAIQSIPQPTSVLDEMEIVSPEVCQAQQSGPQTSGSSTVAQPSALRRTTSGMSVDTSGTKAPGNIHAHASNANQPSSYSPAGQYRYSLPLEDD